MLDDPIRNVKARQKKLLSMTMESSKLSPTEAKEKKDNDWIKKIETSLVHLKRPIWEGILSSNIVKFEHY